MSFDLCCLIEEINLFGQFEHEAVIIPRKCRRLVFEFGVRKLPLTSTLEGKGEVPMALTW